MKIQSTFNRDKETKNKIRFTAAPDSTVQGSIYIDKSTAGDAQTAQVTVETTEPAAAPAA